ncbi:hypothetical protein WG68_03600 [Arsukibacterium ikkense]|uniref:Flagellar hook-length control protein-like C-terminal domain-containing protein n=1 Tax=Arsukibacterium ikkense TaxID=336831 RepID=A0A0M2V9A8_9GAMM|nr:flagellar hook-length control protein FliK [Arsukibacterium ikkense]KKO47024.1 hypothetical protein WG68_03600 [Arsukibacterium ikkense]
MNPLLSLSFLSPGPVANGAESALNELDPAADNSHTDGGFSRLLHQSGDQQTAGRQSFAAFSFMTKSKQAASLEPTQAGRPEISLPPVIPPEAELAALDDTEAASLLGLLDQASQTRQQLATQANEHASGRGMVLADVKVGIKGEWFILPAYPEPAELDADNDQGSDVDSEAAAPDVNLTGQQRLKASKAASAAELTQLFTEQEPAGNGSRAITAATDANEGRAAAVEQAASATLISAAGRPEGGEKLAQPATGSEAAKAQQMSAQLQGSMPKQALATDNADTANLAAAVDNMLLARQSTDLPQQKVAGLQHPAEQATQQVAVAGSLRPATTIFDGVEARLAAKPGSDDLPASAQATLALLSDAAKAKQQQAGGSLTAAAQAKQTSPANTEQSEPAARIDAALSGITRSDVTLTAFNSSFSVPAQAQADVVAARLDAATIATAQQSAERAKTQGAAKTLTEQLKQVNLLEQHAAGQLKERINLMVRQNIQIAEIRLDPADLGQMQIRVNLQQEQASVQFIVQQQHAKELLEQQMPRLREMLQQQGIQLGEGQVQQQRQGESQGQAAGNGRHGQDGQPHADEQATAVQLEVKLSERLVDYYA